MPVGTVNLRPAQLRRIMDEWSNDERSEDVKWIVITPGADHADYVRVALDAGWGSRHFDIAPDGTAADVNWGESTVSLGYV